MKTKLTKTIDIKHEWHLIDVKDQILGRIATDIAQKLIGKNKLYYVANLDCGDYVVVINAEQIKVSGKKIIQKLYNRNSGFPGGFKATTFEQEMAKNPARVIIEAVKGMLPQNKLRDSRLKRLKIFAKAEHTFEDKFKNS